VAFWQPICKVSYWPFSAGRHDGFWPFSAAHGDKACWSNPMQIVGQNECK
jgi:hypothetical protein